MCLKKSNLRNHFRWISGFGCCLSDFETPAMIWLKFLDLFKVMFYSLMGNHHHSPSSGRIFCTCSKHRTSKSKVKWFKLPETSPLKTKGKKKKGEKRKSCWSDQDRIPHKGGKKGTCQKRVEHRARVRAHLARGVAEWFLRAAGRCGNTTNPDMPNMCQSWTCRKRGWSGMISIRRSKRMLPKRSKSPQPRRWRRPSAAAALALHHSQSQTFWLISRGFGC